MADEAKPKVNKGFGPQENGTFIFPSDKITYNHGLKELFKSNGGSYDPETRAFVLPYNTDEAKAKVAEFIKAWFAEVPRYHAHVVPEGFLPAGNPQPQADKPNRAILPAEQRGRFLNTMGIGLKSFLGPTGWMNEFVDKAADLEGAAPFAERLELAQDLLSGEDIASVGIVDPHTVFVRNQLAQRNCVLVQSASGVKGWVVPPSATLDREEWGKRLSEVEALTLDARELKGEAKNLADMQKMLIIDLGLSEVAFGVKANSYNDSALETLGRFELREPFRKAQAAYAKMLKENAELEQDLKDGKPIGNRVKHKILTDDSGKPYVSIFAAAVAEVGKDRIQPSAEDVVSQAAQQQIEEQFKSKDGKSRVKESTGAYVLDDEISKLAHAIMNEHDGDTFGAVVNEIKALQEALPSGAKLVPMRAEQPFVAVEPFIAINEHFLVQRYITHDISGVEHVQYFVYPTSQFLSQIQEAHKTQSMSLGHLLSDPNKIDAVRKAIEDQNEIAVGTHAGVLVAISMTKMRESVARAKGNITSDEQWKALPEEQKAELLKEWDKLTSSAKQELLMAQVIKETAFAGNKNVQATLDKHKALFNAPVIKPLSENASVEEVAEHEANVAALQEQAKARREKIEAARAQVIADAMKVLEPLHKQMVDRATAAHAEPAISDSRSTPVAHRAQPRLPGPIKEATLPAEHAPRAGRIYDIKYRLFVLQEGTQSNKMDANTFKPSADLTYPLLRIRDSGDKFSLSTADHGIAATWQKRKEFVTAGFSHGHLAVLKGDYTQNQVGLDERAAFQREQAREELAAEKEKKDQRKTLTQRYDSSIHKIVGQAESQERDRKKALLKQVCQTVAEHHNLDPNKILLDLQKKNPNATEHDALTKAGIYTEAASTRVILPGETESMATIDFDNIHWMRAEVKAVDRDTVIVYAYDQEQDIHRVIEIDHLANEPVPVVDAHTVESIQIPPRTIQNGDYIEFALVGRDERGLPEYRMEVVDQRIEDLKKAREAASERVKAAGMAPRSTTGVKGDTKEKELTGKAAFQSLKDRGYNPKKVTLLPFSLDGVMTGTLEPAFTPNGDRAIALIENAESYQKQNGELKMHLIMEDKADQDLINRIFSKWADGEMHEAGGQATIVVRDGKVHLVGMKPKNELNQASADEINKAIEAEIERAGGRIGAR